MLTGRGREGEGVTGHRHVATAGRILPTVLQHYTAIVLAHAGACHATQRHNCAISTYFRLDCARLQMQDSKRPTPVARSCAWPAAVFSAPCGDAACIKASAYTQA